MMAAALPTLAEFNSALNFLGDSPRIFKSWSERVLTLHFYI